MEYNKEDLYTPRFRSMWSIISLFELADWINGKAFKKKDYSITGLPIIKIAELNKGLSSNTQYSQYEDYKYYIKKGDILFAWSGNPDTSINTHRFKLEEGYLNQHIFKIIPNNKIIIDDFFYYLMQYLNPNLQEIARNKQTTGLGHVTISDIKKINVRIPRKDSQNKIIKTLLNIDQKIEVNNKIIANLESQAQAVFKSWFIDFEPFQDGEFVESELGMIPKGWEVVSLSKISEIQNGFAFKSRDYKSEGIPVIRTLNIVDGTIEMNNIVSLPNEFYTDAKYKKFILKRFDTLLVMVGSTIGKIGMVHEQNIPSLQNQNMWRFRNKDIFKSQFFIYFLVKAITDEVIGWSSGSARSFFRKDIYLNRKVLLPEETILIGFERICLPIFEQISTLNLQNQKLAQTRDTLLPKLMSGEIDVSNIKIDIEEDNND